MPARPPARLPPLRALQAFEAVARRGSVLEAAGELGVSPGAVSQQLGKIEAVLGLRVLQRRGARLELTSWGRLYAAELAPAFEQLRRAQDKLERARQKSALVLSCLSSVASRWIGPQLFDWQAAHPLARVRLVGAETEPRLGDGATDFRISYGAAAREFAAHCSLFRDVLVPACAPSLLKAQRLRRPADLLTLPLIGIEWDAKHGALADWPDWATHIGAAPAASASALTFSLSSAAIDAAVNGRGVVLAQLSLIGNDLASGRLVVPFDRRLELPQPYFLAWDEDALQKPFGSELRDWIVVIARRQAQAAHAALPAATRLKKPD